MWRHAVKLSNCSCWHCLHSMQNTVSLCLSVYLIRKPHCGFAAVGRASRRWYWLIAAWHADAGSATLSADVGSWRQTCLHQQRLLLDVAATWQLLCRTNCDFLLFSSYFIATAFIRQRWVREFHILILLCFNLLWNILMVYCKCFRLCFLIHDQARYMCDENFSSEKFPFICVILF